MKKKKRKKKKRKNTYIYKCVFIYNMYTYIYI